jgi:hypothetical protein
VSAVRYYVIMTLIAVFVCLVFLLGVLLWAAAAGSML